MKEALKAKIKMKWIFMNKLQSEKKRFEILAEKYPSKDYNKGHYLSLVARLDKQINDAQQEIIKLEAEYETIVDFKPMTGLKAISSAEYRSQE